MNIILKSAIWTVGWAAISAAFVTYFHKHCPDVTATNFVMEVLFPTSIAFISHATPQRSLIPFVAPNGRKDDPPK